MWSTRVRINDRDIEVRLSQAAQQQLAERHSPLTVELELFFSCLIRKRVRFHDQQSGTPVTDGLHLDFHPVMTRHCSDRELETDGPPMTDFPLDKPQAFTPHWVSIDFRKGEWHGEFGY